LPALTFRFVEALARSSDLLVITSVRNRTGIEEQRPSGIEFEYVDTEWIASPLHRLTEWLAGDSQKAMTLRVATKYPSYLAFEIQAWRAYRDRIKRGEFDVVHRVSPMSPTIPSPIASWIAPVPFVIGPLLGALPWPPQYTRAMRREREWLNYVRGLHRMLPFYRSTYRSASAVLAAYPHTIEDLPRQCRDRVVPFSEGGIDPAQFPDSEKKIAQPMTILFVGRLVPFKQPSVLVECFRRSPKLREHRLVIVGDGPERPALEEAIRENGLQDVVELRGELPFEEVVALMHESEIFAFPSIREQGGGVLTMATLARMACVVVEYGGPAYRVPEGCGVRIPLAKAEALTRDFVKALEGLVERPDRVRELGQAARRFTIAHYSWEAKAAKATEVYRQLRERPHP
jgi:glycosyltransferase involved in cell wall biosynthesis